ncbi:PH domain containing protein [Nitzschia inconspicua]|uniref:PH domain containing protein n=1 Tax=Nitzschia inconspicua TaxID=303405 RepID=A0A9K3LRB5_9STRA|nr:PH domain containing protein [Nitzschia inconspicua]
MPLPPLSSGDAESHRIYWQQWLSTTTAATGISASTPSVNLPGPGGGIATSSTTSPPSSPLRRRQQQAFRRRQLTTSSAAVRIAPQVAKAHDVTDLLRRTLNLASSTTKSNGTVDSKDSFEDSLVLVGTLIVPNDHVSFEHEHGLAENNNKKLKSPFHLVKTLHADDNPLAMRDEMMKHLKERHVRLRNQYGAIDQLATPTIQWFFVPGFGAPSIIPNCVELEGYATTMEGADDYSDDEDDDDDDEIDVDYGHNIGESYHCSTAESLMESRDDVFANLPELVRASLFESSFPFSLPQPKTTSTRQEKRKIREWRRYLQVSQSHNSNPNYLAGYLLKQSSKDKHVWRKVYCLLTEDYMWYVHRMTPWYEQQSTSDRTICLDVCEETIAMAPKHGRISLSQALLLEPNEEFEQSPLHRVPHAFQIADGRGIIHSFRASSKSLSRQWIQSISTRLMDCYENSFLENAELIIAEETMARNQRYKSVAVDALFSKVNTMATGSKTSSQTSFASHNDHVVDEDEKHEICRGTQTLVDLCMRSPRTEDNHGSTFQAQVVRLGIDVAEFREGCRHIQTMLLSQVGIESDREEKDPHLPVLSSAIPKMVQESWHTASELLGRATQIASLVQIDCGQGKISRKHPSRSLDTLCHHIEFVITGQMRRRSAGSPTSSATSMDVAAVHHPDDPPPMDLFDRLLTELQQSASF